jgi:aerobic carbon-monoxide dehydrogenase small subunit
MQTNITLHVNGERFDTAVQPHETLLDVIRNRFELTGTKRGCDEGTCGACTVLVDGEVALGCLTLAVRCDGKQILTVEGLSRDGELHPLQKSAVEHGAVQCGYCTPGWLLSAKALLDRNPRPNAQQVRTAIGGHLCRCTGYKKIEESVLAVANSHR